MAQEQAEVNAGNGVATEGKDESHLLVVLTQQSYDAIKNVVDLATERGLESSFDHWLNDAIKGGCNARTRTWTDRDKVSLLNDAAKGNAKAIKKLQELIAKHAAQ